jgi:hypothetical protein
MGHKNNSILVLSQRLSRTVMRGLYFHCLLLLFIVCTITVGHVTEDLYFRT